MHFYSEICKYDRHIFKYEKIRLKYRLSFRMSNILHLRHMKVWLRPNFLFNLTKYGKDQIRLLEIIHGLTKKIIARKKQEYKSGKRNVIDTSAQNGNAKSNKVITYFLLRYMCNVCLCIC